MVGFVLAIIVALWLASNLDRRQIHQFGLNLDRQWFGNVVVGVAISLAAFLISIWYAELRGVIEITSSNSDGSLDSIGIAVLVGMVIILVYLLIQHIYEEIVYRGIMLQNFAEGLVDRGISPIGSIVIATVGSSLAFALFHIPLRGIAPAVDAAFVGITFALAYVLTGNLGLAIGVHFGRVPIELFVAGEASLVGIPAVIEFTAAAPDVELLRMGVTSIAILGWVYVVYGDISIEESVYRSNGA